MEKRVKHECEKEKQRKDKGRRCLLFAFRRELREAIPSLPRILGRNKVTEGHLVSFVPNGWVYSHMIIIFAFEDSYHFALLQSSTHEEWLRRGASTMRTDIRYKPTYCFDNFPFSQEPTKDQKNTAERMGAKYYKCRQQIMTSRELWLIKIYNLYNNPECLDSDIICLCELYVEMDRSLFACYGWVYIDLAHGFYENERDHIRFSLSLQSKRELIRRLLELYKKSALG